MENKIYKMKNVWISSWNHCDIFGKGILIILGILSIYSWFVMIEKYLTIKEARRKNKTFEKYFIFKKEVKKISCPLYNIVNFLSSLIKYEKMPLEIAKKYINIAFTKEQSNLEKNLSSLITITSIAPFLGLLGTIWGLLISFTNMSVTGSSSIRVVAGGVAEALITTVLGLMVAIPAAVGYNFFKDRIQNLIEEMEFLIPRIESFLNEILIDEKQEK